MELVLLFGSRARGDATDRSDFDIGIVFEPGRSVGPGELEDVRRALGGGDHLDLINLSTADPLLLRLAAEEGEPRFESQPGVIEEFRLKAHKRYMDTAKFRKLEADSLRALYG